MKAKEEKKEPVCLVVEEKTEALNNVALTEYFMHDENLREIPVLKPFPNLVKLVLSHNEVKQIKNLSLLGCLKWLDLSFNKIKKIEGLEKCKNISDLVLSFNNISKIEGLESLKKLECLELASNFLENFDDLKRLKDPSFTLLSSLSVKGNVIDAENSYRPKVIALLPSLDFLDQKFIKLTERNSAVKMFKNDFQLLNVEFDAAKRKLKNKLKEIAQDEKISKAGLSSLKELFSKIEFKIQKGKICEVESIKILNEQLTQEISGKSMDFLSKGLDLFCKVEKLLQNFQCKILGIVKQSDVIGLKALEETKIHLLDVESENEVKCVTEKFKTKMKTNTSEEEEKSLILLEELEKDIKSTKITRFDLNSAYFRLCEELENSWFSSVDVQLGTLSSEQLNNLKKSKEDLEGELQALHDDHLEKILANEDIMRTWLEEEHQCLVSTQKQLIHERARNRVKEVNEIIETFVGESEILSSD